MQSKRTRKTKENLAHIAYIEEWTVSVALDASVRDRSLLRLMARMLKLCLKHTRY